MSDKLKILAVDDEEFNLDIITDYLSEAGYEIIQAVDGVDAIEKLGQNQDVAVIVLDRMMPRMNGMEVVAKLKNDDRFSAIPIVMQTAAASSQQILEGVQSGVYHYLTKPYNGEMLTGIVGAAVRDAQNRKGLLDEIRKHKTALGLIESGRFRFRTLEEAKNLAYLIASCLPDPEIMVYGLNELMINAVEHGNLGITYAEKTRLVFEGKWHDEVERRLDLPENKNKFARLFMETMDGIINIKIVDEGAGFDWQKYIDISPDRATDPNGRGIATSKMMSFDNMEYIGNGNEVRFSVKL